MKIILLIIILLAAFLIKCTFSGNSIQYVFENKSATLQEPWPKVMGDTSSDRFISFLTYQRNTSKKEPIKVQYYFHERTPEVKSLQSVNIKLLSKDKDGKVFELPSTSTLSIEYYNGAINFKREIENTDKPIHTLIDWKDVNYEYEFNGVQYTKEPNTLSFDGEIKCNTKEYPDTLKLIFTLQWQDRSHTIEKVLTKEKYTSPKINPKF